MPFASPQSVSLQCCILWVANLPNGEPVGELGYWVRARRYRDRATENLHLAETAPSFDVRQRYFKVARHYLQLAEFEELDAKREAGKTVAVKPADAVAQPALTADQPADRAA